eukprot:scaffold140238_cov17-Prasinocladus_malaysianus.AAC.2
MRCAGGRVAPHRRVGGGGQGCPGGRGGRVRLQVRFQSARDCTNKHQQQFLSVSAIIHECLPVQRRTHSLDN